MTKLAFITHYSNAPRRPPAGDPVLHVRHFTCCDKLTRVPNAALPWLNCGSPLQQVASISISFLPLRWCCWLCTKGHLSLSALQATVWVTKKQLARRLLSFSPLFCFPILLSFLPFVPSLSLYLNSLATILSGWSQFPSFCQFHCHGFVFGWWTRSHQDKIYSSKDSGDRTVSITSAVFCPFKQNNHLTNGLWNPSNSITLPKSDAQPLTL